MKIEKKDELKEHLIYKELFGFLAEWYNFNYGGGYPDQILYDLNGLLSFAQFVISKQKENEQK